MINSIAKCFTSLRLFLVSNRFLYALSFLLLLVALVAKPVNIIGLVDMGLVTNNQFIDGVIYLSDLVVIMGAFGLLCLTRRIDVRIVGLLTFLLGVPRLWIDLLFEGDGFDFYTNFFLLKQGIQFILVWSRILLWFAILREVFSSSIIPLKHRFALAIPLIFSGLVDYFLISDSRVLLIIIAIWLVIFRSKPSKELVGQLWQALLILIIGGNAVFAIGQVYLKHSVGLELIEPVLSSDGVGLAKLSLPNFGVILRGYGLMAHPNILGFLGVIVTLTTLLLGRKMFSRNAQRLLIIFALTCVFISFSRSAWLSTILSIIVFFLPHKNYNINFLNKLINSRIVLSLLAGLVLVIILPFSTLVTNSDSYRMADLLRYRDTVITLPLEYLLFGLGLGQYPWYLYLVQQLAPWQWQPVHNIFLYLAISFGVIPSIVISLVVIVFSWRRIRRINKKSFISRKPILMTTWYNPGESERVNELEYALQTNINSELFDSTHVFCEKEVPQFLKNNPKVKISIIPKRPSYAQILSVAIQNYSDFPVLIANCDIVWGERISEVAGILQKNQVVCLVRTESDGGLSKEFRIDYLGNKYAHSHDGWLLYPPPRIVDDTIELGRVGCESRFVACLFVLGYEIRAIGEQYLARHVHTSHIRGWGLQNEGKHWLLFPAIQSSHAIQIKPPRYIITYN